MAKSLNFDNAIKGGNKLNRIPKNLGEKLNFIISYDNEVYTERGANFVPMGTAYYDSFNDSFTIYLNNFYIRQSQLREIAWSRIFWHELGHLIDVHEMSHQVFGDQIIKNSKKMKKLNRYIPMMMCQHKIAAYFTKPHLILGKIKYERMIEEVYTECFAKIMTIISMGATKKTVNSLCRHKGFINTYLQVIITLINKLNFKEIGLNISPLKKQKMITIFKEVADNENKKYQFKTVK